MSSVGVVPFFLFIGPDGETVLQKAEDISTVIFEARKATPKRPAYVATVLLLANKNRVEVMGEDLGSLWDRFEAANSFRPLVLNSAGAMKEEAIHTFLTAQLQPEKEAVSA